MEYILALTAEQAEQVLRRTMDEREPLGYDTETEGVDITQETPVQKGNVVCFSIAGDGWKSCIDGEFLGMFKSWLESETHKKYVANAKFEQHIAANHHIRIAGLQLDTVLASFTLYPHLYSHSVEKAGRREFGESKRPFMEVVPDADTVRAWTMERDEFALYSADDAMWERKLGIRLEAKLREAPWRANLPLWNYYDKYQAPFNDVLFEMERYGVLLDQEFLHAARKRATKLLSETEVATVKALGFVPRHIDKFMGSTAELIKELYDRRKFPVMKTKGKSCLVCARTVDKNELFCPKHPSGGIKPTPSVDANALEVLFKYKADPLLRLIIKWKKISKKIEEFDKLLTAVNPFTGRMHTSYNGATARTGRITSSNPNVANVSQNDKETAYGKQLGYAPFYTRQAFLADAANGYNFVDHDFSQIEPRLLAHFSQEPVLLDGFRRGADFYSIAAKAIFKLDCDLADVKALYPDLRNKTKQAELTLNYGGGRTKLSWGLGCSEREAQKLIDDRRAAMPVLYAWQERQKVLAKERGYVPNILGWRRPVPDIHYPGDDDVAKQKRAKAERISLNHPNQSGATEVIKTVQMTLLGVRGWKSEISERYRRLGGRMIFQIYDEILTECPQDNAKEIAELTSSIMEHPFPRELSVPLKAEWGMGVDWAGAH